MTGGSKPQRIEPEYHNKIWGSPRIEPWFETRGEQLTGEVWFPADDLLIKFLFTSQNLSVQVHPDDNYARVHENSRGKTEMWHILRADSGARIALGFRRPISPDCLASSAKSGEIMDLLNWVEVRPGETYFIPAGTVHAIGSGLALCEIQQNSDVTYRLYDYGRDRPLHLARGAEVSDLGTHPGKSLSREAGDGVISIAECPYFHTYQAVIDRPGIWNPPGGVRFLIVLEGAGQIDGLPVSAGQVFRVDSSREWMLSPSTPFKVLLTG